MYLTFPFNMPSVLLYFIFEILGNVCKINFNVKALYLQLCVAWSPHVVSALFLPAVVIWAGAITHQEQRSISQTICSILGEKLPCRKTTFVSVCVTQRIDSHMVTNIEHNVYAHLHTTELCESYNNWCIVSEWKIELNVGWDCGKLRTIVRRGAFTYRNTQPFSGE